MATKVKTNERDLKDSDIILNLSEIAVSALDSFSSSSCSGRATFSINCNTKHGYTEDPKFTGKIRIIDAKKSSKNGVYLLKVKFEKEKEEDF